MQRGKLARKVRNVQQENETRSHFAIDFFTWA